MLNYATWIPFFFSACAVAVSIYTLWRSHLASPKLEILPATRVTFSRNPNVPGAQAPAITVSFVVYNAGANMGYIDDVAVLVFRRDDSESALFRSLYEDRSEKTDYSKRLQSPDLRPFTTFAVAPRESTFKSVFLVIEGQPSFSISPGEYDVTIYTIGRSAKWRSWPIQSVTIDESDVEGMRPKVTVTGPGEQFVELHSISKPTGQSSNSLKRLRKQLHLPEPVFGEPPKSAEGLAIPSPSGRPQGPTFSISTGSTGSASSNLKTRE